MKTIIQKWYYSENDLNSFSLKDIYEKANIIKKLILGYGKSVLLDDFSLDEKQTIVNQLRTIGFNVVQDEWRDILRVAKILDEVDKERPLAFSNTEIPISHDMSKSVSIGLSDTQVVSLNCFLSDKIRQEFIALEELIGSSKLQKKCRLLVSFVQEIELKSKQRPEYPGRRLPVRVESNKRTWRYMRLRVLDELLSTSSEPLSMEKLIALTTGRLISINPDFRDFKVTNSILKKDLKLLNDCLFPDPDLKNNTSYTYRAFEKKYGKGHLYKVYKDNRRLSAFSIDLTYSESKALFLEIKRFKRYFELDNDQFIKKFPALSILGSFNPSLNFVKDNSKTVKRIGNTITVHLQNFVYPEIKEKVEHLISSQVPFNYVHEDSIEQVLPIAINFKGEEWSLIVKSFTTNRMSLIPAQELLPSFSKRHKDSFQSDISQAETTIIGISPLLTDTPINVEIELTQEGRSSLELTCPRLKKLIDSAKIIKNSVVFSVFPNNDFFDELVRLDQCGKLVDINNAEVKKMYIDYFEKTRGEKWIPRVDRYPSQKRLRNKKINK